MSVHSGSLSSTTGARIASILGSVRAALALAALALPLTAAPVLDDPLPAPGGVSLFISDVVVALALLCWLVARVVAPAKLRPGVLHTPLLGWPVLVLFAAFLPGLVRGHERYDASLVGQPLRLVLYAGIAAAFVDLRPRDLYRGIVALFYTGAVWQAALGIYHLAAGTAQTPISSLTTGGSRTLALFVAMYLAGTLVLALVNLELDDARRRQVLHVSMIAVSTFGILLSFGRTTYVALAVVLSLLVWKLPRMRSNLRRLWKVWVPVLVVGVGAVAVAAPQLGPTLADRVSANPLTDRSVRWRIRGTGAVLNAMRRPGERAAARPYSPQVVNELENGGFEQRTAGWSVVGGRVSTIPSNNLNFGARTLAFVANGGALQEVVSERVVASPGETWSFAVWLRAGLGEVDAAVGIRAYDAQGRPVEHYSFPARLTVLVERVTVNAALADPEIRSVAAVLESRDPDPARLLADAGQLEVVTHDGRQNFVADGSFERGTEGWRMQGGEFSRGSEEGAVYGEHSLAFTTDGAERDQGPYSGAVLARTGQAWSFSVWLRGASGGELVNVGLWEYDREGEGVGQSNLPVRLTTTPTRYTVNRVVTSDAAVAVRAVIRTRLAAAVTVFADGTLLERASPPTPFLPRDERLAPDVRAAGPIQVDELVLGPGWGRTVTYVFEGRVYQNEGDPDNSYVYILGGGGILALGAFLLLLAIFARDSWLRLRFARGYERALVLWALATWFVFMVNCLMAPFLPRPKLVLTIWALMLVPALVRPVRSGLLAQGLDADDVSAPRRLDGGEHEGEAADVVPSARLGLSALADRGRELRERARAVLHLDPDKRDGSRKRTPPDSTP